MTDFFAFLDQGAVLPWLPEADSQNRTVIQAAVLGAPARSGLTGEGVAGRPDR
ncbi:MAG: hypothetical protein M3130_00920 [Actinomycetota bacterium]|nr:hypothetical protein [Actinomycetota bacterium]